MKVREFTEMTVSLIAARLPIVRRCGPVTKRIADRASSLAFSEPDGKYGHASLKGPKLI